MEALGKVCDVTIQPNLHKNYKKRKEIKSQTQNLGEEDEEEEFNLVESKVISHHKSSYGKKIGQPNIQPIVNMKPQVPYNANTYSKSTNTSNQSNQYSFASIHSQPHRSAKDLVTLGNEWEPVFELSKQKFDKVTYTPAKPILLSEAGIVGEYNTLYDKITNNTIPILKALDNITFPSPSNIFEIQMKKIKEDNPGIRVFMSDSVSAMLMTFQLAVNPWEITLNINQNKLYFYIYEEKLYLSYGVHESGNKNPIENTSEKSLNSFKNLADESANVYNFFSQMALKSDSDLKLKKESPHGSNKNLKRGYLYWKWNLDSSLEICIRSTVDSYLKNENNEAEYISLNVVNEYGPSETKIWRENMFKNRSSILSTVVSHETLHLAKWILRAEMAGINSMRLGFAVRKSVKENTKHELLAVSKYAREEISKLLNMNYNNSWGILRVMIKSLLDLGDGTYKLVKDNYKTMIRVYKQIKQVTSEFN